MSPFSIVVVLIGLIAIYAWSKLQQELRRLNDEEKREALAKAAKKSVPKKKTQTLKQDPETGVYRLEDD